MKKVKLFVLTAFVGVLAACSQESKVIGSWRHIDDGDVNIIVLHKDKRATVDGGVGITKGTWKVKGGYVFVDRDERADIMAEIPSGDFNSLTFEENPDSDSNYSWNSDVFTKVDLQ